MVVTLGIDLGTAACKGLLYDSGGHSLQLETAAYPTRHPQPGWVEQDQAAWLAAVQAVCDRLARHAAWPDVAALGLSGQMHTLTLLDGCGQPLLPAIVWQDTRSADILARLEPGLRAWIRQISCNWPHTIMTLLPLLWLQAWRPECLAAARRLLLPKDYLRYRLTGVAATDPSDASGTQLFDPHRRGWSAELLEHWRLPAQILPEICPATALAGIMDAQGSRLTGLPAGLPVIAGAADLAAETCSCWQGSDDLVIRYGTAGAAVRRRPLPAAGPAHCYASEDPLAWLMVAGTQACGASVEWARGALLGNLDYARLYGAARAVPAGARDLLFVPHLAGERAPYFDPGLRAHLVGITIEHGAAHIARAVLEGVAFSLKDAAAVLPGWESVRQIRLIGGQGEQAFWGQLLADVFDREVTWLPQAGAAMGAAMLASRALGECAAMPQAALTFAPEAGAAGVYRDSFIRYQEAIHAFGHCSGTEHDP